MKNLKKLYVTLVLLSYTLTAILGNSYNSDRADISNIVKQEIYKLNGLQEGFQLIGKNFEKFVDTNIAKLMPAEDNADVDAIELLDALNQKIEDEILKEITPLVVVQVKTAIENKEDLKIDNPEKFAKKHSVLNYALENKDSFTGQIFRDTKEPSGEIIKSVLNTPQKDFYSEIFLIAAFRKNNLSVIQFLLAGGVDMNVRDRRGDTPLYLAIEYNLDKAVQLLIDHGADVNTTNPLDGFTFLHLAAKFNSDKVVPILIDNGVDVNAIDLDRQTPMHLATTYDAHKVIPILIDNSADLNARDKDGNTPLDYSAGKNYADKVVQLLIDNGADVNARNEKAWTPLHYAASGGADKVVQLLIDNGADVNARNEKAWTPLHYAASWGADKVIPILIDNGVDINARDKDGKTAFNYATTLEICNLIADAQKRKKFNEVVVYNPDGTKIITIYGLPRNKEQKIIIQPDGSKEITNYWFNGTDIKNIEKYNKQGKQIKSDSTFQQHPSLVSLTNNKEDQRGIN